MKKILGLALTASLSLSLAACSGNTNNSSSPAPSDTTTPVATTETPETPETRTLKLAALETAYGADVWKEIIAGFEKANPGVKVESTIDKSIEDVIGPAMKSGDFPDVIHLAVGQPKGLTETFVKDNNLTDLTDVLSMTIPGESGTVKDKIIPGFTDTTITNPYGDGKTYLMPMFYSPTGLFYNAGLLEQKGWTVPTTWDEMWALGDKAKADGIALFSYPTTGYFDSFFYALLNEVGGPEFFTKAMHYTEGVWQSPEATQAFDIINKLAAYTEKTVPANGNKDNFTKNQQLILDNKAIFMPNGTWVVGEMSKAPRAEGFKWGFTALPAVKEGGDRFSYTFFEQIWVPAKAKNADLAKQFIAYLYSDEAAGVFAKVGAVQPIKDMASKLEGDNKLFYSIYDNGAKAAMGAFSTTDPVEGVSISDTVFGTVDSLVTKAKTQAQWVEAITKASDALRGALK
ncbi:carbohydrate ABC transporter substrate-binding protein [Paenibacillus macquariensis]|uniref:Carbohydrate ABC transporter substrate-binding protein, CUT1 family n=1 Tax=Paenibacillus macquariensis TaxID=948756 RepID=A0ABY1JZJ1_9BACL|nr:carbohydrate ABC transporter substrate-binding protein [Paenibacillus macquariensis]MEC0091290.1 carbohydrate ABC transporter substrate-binding protein [Paenibacillus macquariensis]SIR03676.1 carbohydrate ABC transporter substrate-binding protein, CUT1 family [Paenibacillus macquariensis]